MPGTATVGGTLTASDVDAGATQNWTLQGTPSTTYGTVVLNPTTGIWTYTLDNTLPATQALKEGDVVTQTYTARVTDDFGAYVDQTITVTINGTNDVPVVTNAPADTAGTVTEAGHLDDGTSVPGTATVGGTLTASDVDAGATQNWTLQGTPSTTYGTIALNPTTGVWTYTLDNTLPATQALKEGDVVTETYTARVTDDFGAYVDQTITVTINGTNDAPVAVNDTGHSPDGRPVTIAVLGNDTDIEGTPLTVSAIAGVPVAPGGTVTIPEGVVTLNTDGTLTFAPKPGIQGQVVFPYAISDGNGGTATAQVTISVVPEPNFISSGPRTQLPSNYTLFGDQDIFYYGDAYNSLIRQTIPFSPAVFIHQTVDLAQQERMAVDSLSFSNPDMVRLGDIESHSIGAELGFDPALFVQHAVRDSQAQGAFIDNIVNGRLTRISLSSDRLIPTPDLYQPNPLEIMPPSRFAETTDIQEHDVLPDNHMESETPVTQSTAGHPHANAWAAPSFSEQIRTAGGYGPIAQSGSPHQRPHLKPY